MNTEHTRKAGPLTVTRQVRTRSVLFSVGRTVFSLAFGAWLILYGYSIEAVGDAFELLLIMMILSGVISLVYGSFGLLLEASLFSDLLQHLEDGEMQNQDARTVMAKNGQGRGLGVAVVRSIFTHRYLSGGCNPPNIETLLESMEDRLASSGHKVATMGTITVLVGTIGTIAGMLLAMTSMSSAGDVQGLVEAFFAQNGVLSGFSTALITTLIGGIGGGLVLRMLSEAFLSLCRRHVLFVHEMCSYYIVPALYGDGTPGQGDR